MANARIKLNRSQIRAYLNSDTVVENLNQLGEEIASRAESATKTRATGMRNPDYVVRTVTGSGRASCFVWAANINSFLAEAHDRTLSKAAAG